MLSLHSMDSYEIVVRIALIRAHGTKCPADHGINSYPFFRAFLVSPPQKGGIGGRFSIKFLHSFHGAPGDIHHLYLVNFSTLKPSLVPHSFN